MEEIKRHKLKQIRHEIKLIRDERRELLKEYRYWKLKEYKITGKH